jgi:hypothetical protein
VNHSSGPESSDFSHCDPPDQTSERTSAAFIGETCLPAVYIVCEHDEALPPDLQRIQARNAGASEVLPFDSGHSAFASKPRELAELLLCLG